jgi:hypothetical protein
MPSFFCHRRSIPDLNRAGAVKRADGSRSSLTSLFPEFFHRHHDIAIVERDVGRGAELKGDSARPDFLDRKVNRAIPDLKHQSETDLPEAGVHFLDPILESFGGECAHVPAENEVDEIPDSFALLFRARMHLDHAGV